MNELVTLPTPKLKRKLEEVKVEEETPKKSKWSFLTEKQLAEVALIFADVLLGSESALSVVPADTHYVLHLRKLTGQVSLKTLELALQRFNQIYQVRSVTIELDRQFIDVRFRLAVTGADPPNVVVIGSRVLPDITKSLIAKIPPNHGRDANDFCLISALMTHAENILGPDSPTDLDVTVDTPDGSVLLTNGVQETKVTRSNYLMKITGYRQLDIEHLRSFTHVLPFHSHSPSIDFDRKSVQVQLERYNAPITGDVVVLRDDISAPLR